jgi:hypothetical protein
MELKFTCIITKKTVRQDKSDHVQKMKGSNSATVATVHTAKWYLRVPTVRTAVRNKKSYITHKVVSRASLPTTRSSV